MTHEDRSFLIRVIAWYELLELVMQQQIARQPKYAAEFRGCCDAGKNRHGTALGEATEDDAIRRNTGFDFRSNEGVEVVAGFEDTFLVLTGLEVPEFDLEDYEQDDLRMMECTVWAVNERCREVLQYHTILASAFQSSGKG